MFFFYLGVSVKPLQVCWLHPVFLGGGLLFSMHFQCIFQGLFIFLTIRSSFFFQLHLKDSETRRERFCLSYYFQEQSSSFPWFSCRWWLTECSLCIVSITILSVLRTLGIFVKNTSLISTGSLRFGMTSKRLWLFNLVNDQFTGSNWYFVHVNIKNLLFKPNLFPLLLDHDLAPMQAWKQIKEFRNCIYLFVSLS